MRRPRKTVEITLRVSVPADMSTRRARFEVVNGWYGEIYASTDAGRDVTLRPRWGKARLVKRGD